MSNPDKSSCFKKYDSIEEVEEVKQLQKKIEKLDILLIEKDMRIEEILRSKSWKITRPFRNIAHQIRRMKSGIKTGINLYFWIYRNKKMIPVYFPKIYATLKQEGMHSFYNKIRKKLAQKSDETFTYLEWIRKNDTITIEDREKIKERIKLLKYKPLFSIILPVYNTKKKFLIEAISSVRNQIYPDWELCIADDASTSPYIQEILDQAAKNDPRIKIVFRKENGHISQSSNSALSLASGDWVTFLDHDDVLAEHALYMIAEEINANPDALLIYSDEDKIDETENRFDPHFKPDWNPDFFMSYNYICHMVAVKKPILKKIGGFRVGVEGAQDYDLLLRYLCEIENSANIRHIPHILYHWRSHPGSTALATDEKNYAHDAGLKALNDYWKKKDPNVQILNGLFHCTYRIYHPIPSPSPLASIIIPTKGKGDLIKKCLNSILTKTSYSPFEIILVSSQGADPNIFGYFKEMIKDPRIRTLHYDNPFNYSAVNNYAAENAKGTILVLLNDDTEVINGDWLEELVRQASRPEIGAVGAKLLYPDGNIQHAGFYLGIGEDTGGHGFRFLGGEDPGYCCRAQVIQNLSAVTGACLAVRKESFFDVGGLNTDLAVTCNDVDLCLKLLKKGYRNLWSPYVKLFHYELASRGRDDSEGKIKRFKEESAYMKTCWAEIISQDPAYNPNLTFESEDFSIAKISRAKTPWVRSLSQEQNPVLNKGIKILEQPIFEFFPSPMRILVIKLDHLGDFLSAIPALYRLREKFKKSEFDLICGPWNKPLAEDIGLFRNIFCLNFFQDASGEGIKRNKKEEDALIECLKNYDIAIDLRSYPETRSLLARVPASLKVGYRTHSKADAFLDVCLENADRPDRHVSQKLLDLINAIPYESFNFSGFDIFKKSEQKPGEPIIGIFPAAGSTARQWPLENFVELVKKISAFNLEWEINVYLPPKENSMGIFFKNIGENIKILDSLPMKDLLISVGSCRIVISNNSFGAHLPGYLGREVIAIYSGVIPIPEWQPAVGKQKIIYSDVSCSPCYLTHNYQCTHNMLCLKQISPDLVFTKVVESLATISFESS